MFCPTCRTEYIEGTSVCPDCGAALVPELPADAESELPEDVEYEEILATFNAGAVAIIKSLLDGEGIDYYFRGEFFNYVDPLIQPPRLMVRAGQVEEAKEILKDLRIAYGLSVETKDWPDE